MRSNVEKQEMDPAEDLVEDLDEDVATRRCLVCSVRFTSLWAGERVCRKCKSSTAWRQG